MLSKPSSDTPLTYLPEETHGQVAHLPSSRDEIDEMDLIVPPPKLWVWDK